MGRLHGIDAVLDPTPPAAGLSSSSALIVAFTRPARANQREATFENSCPSFRWRAVCRHRGGGMDHAASLASREGHASSSNSRPRHPPHPDTRRWAFLSLTPCTPPKNQAPFVSATTTFAAGTQALAAVGFLVHRALDRCPTTAPASPSPLSLMRDAFPTWSPKPTASAMPSRRCAPTSPRSANSCSIPTPACAIASASAVPRSIASWRLPWPPEPSARASPGLVSVAAPSSSAPHRSPRRPRRPHRALLFRHGRAYI